MWATAPAPAPSPPTRSTLLAAPNATPTNPPVHKAKWRPDQPRLPPKEQHMGDDGRWH